MRGWAESAVPCHCRDRLGRDAVSVALEIRFNALRRGLAGMSSVVGSRIARIHLKFWDTGRLQPSNRPIDAVGHVTACHYGIVYVRSLDKLPDTGTAAIESRAGAACPSTKFSPNVNYNPV